MTQDDARRGDPDTPSSAPGGEGPQPGSPPPPPYGAPGATAGGQQHGAQPGWAPPPCSAPPPGYGGQPGYDSPPGYGPPPGYDSPPGYGGQPAYGGQPGWGGHPGWGQPGYGPPGYGPPPGYGYPRPTNTLAILALVMAFVFSPVGLVLGIVARRQIRETGEQGDGLALAGIIVGGLGTALAVFGFLFFLLALGAAGSVGFAP
jgi:hypothetical protein